MGQQRNAHAGWTGKARAFRRQMAAVALALLAIPAASADALRVATGEYPPFTSSTAPGGGTVNAAMSEIGRAAGYTLSFTYLPWARALEMTRAGRYHATSFWYYSTAREDDFIHVGPVGTDRLVFFRRKNNPISYTQLEDLAPYSIGVVRSYTYTAELWQLGNAGVLRLQLAPDDMTNFRKLLAGRIDLYAISEQSGWHFIRTNFTKAEQAQLTTVDRPLSMAKIYLLVSRALENADEIAAALQANVPASDDAPQQTARNTQ
ncbi:MAG: transporter substrate-binding domain-containing protein [Pseudomonadota bacterium]